MLRALIIILFVATSNRVVASPDNDILGTWQLVEVIVTSLADSNPRGIPTAKEHYTGDGRLYFIGPSKSLDSNTQWVKYHIDGKKRVVQIDGGSEFYATITFRGLDYLVVTQEAGDQWHYKRLKGSKAIDKVLEPVSVEVLRPGDEDETVAYDSQDYSALPNQERLIGIWETIAHGNVPRHKAPPYGYLNDIWIFDGSNISIIKRAQSSETQAVSIPYKFDNDTIEVGDRRNNSHSYTISFNSWGHLVLNVGGQAITMKLLKKSVSKPHNLPPVKIVLLYLEGEPTDL